MSLRDRRRLRRPTVTIRSSENGDEECMAERQPFIIDADWLQERLGKPGLSIIDASWYLPAHKRDAARRIRGGAHSGRALLRPGSRASIRIRAAAHFAAAGIFARMSARWESLPTTRSSSMTARVCSRRRACGGCSASMGAKNVFLLDGGFDRWKAEGRPVTAEPTKIAPDVFHVDFDAEPGRRRSRTCEDRRDRGAPDRRRAAGRPLHRRRAGAAPRRARRPYAGCHERAGHDAVQDGKLLPPEELRETLRGGRHRSFETRGHVMRFRRHRGGISLALETLGHNDNRLYDGSWTEWGGRNDTPVVTRKDEHESRTAGRISRSR